MWCRGQASGREIPAVLFGRHASHLTSSRQRLLVTLLVFSSISREPGVWGWGTSSGGAAP